MSSRVRVLIVGRSGVGKSALVNAILNASLADVRHDQAGETDINREMSSEHNKLLVLHDSEGYEPGEDEKADVLEDFVKRRGREKHITERINVIWLCAPVPFAGARAFEDGDERMLRLEGKVPIIVVFTKYDLLVASATWQLRRTDANDRAIQQKSREMAETFFQDECISPFEEFTKYISRNIPCVPVSIKDPNSLRKLCDITLKSARTIS